MKCILLPMFLLLMLSTTGCSLFGWYMNGDTQPNRIIDREEWTKPNINEAQKKEDWISCGGTSRGTVYFTPLTHEGRLTTEDYIQADKESDAAQACMMKKGYHYTGRCRGEPSKRFACKGRSIFNL